MLQGREQGFFERQVQMQFQPGFFGLLVELASGLFAVNLVSFLHSDDGLFRTMKNITPRLTARTGESLLFHELSNIRAMSSRPTKRDFGTFRSLTMPGRRNSRHYKLSLGRSISQAGPHRAVNVVSVIMAAKDGISKSHLRLEKGWSHAPFHVSQAHSRVDNPLRELFTM